VLFVGNSYTAVNDLPSLVAHLAAAAGEPFRLNAVQDCPGGATLKQHWESARDTALLAESHFDWMVLQEQSETPSLDRARLERDMYPYVDRLYAAAAGSYLAACVIYRNLFVHGAVGNSFTAGLAPEVARRLQEIADGS
jgi:hypothetical protein